ncbi:MAG: hypothetical protein ACYS47_06500 [Planctomycetota bacterium]|jgi:hypothetical protein
MRYHHFIAEDLIDVVLLEVKSREYLWLSFYLNPVLRNGYIGNQTAKHILHSLVGIHHIHWPPEVKMFEKLSKELHWQENGGSDIFYQCRATCTSSLEFPPPLSPLLGTLLKHHLKRTRPELKSFESKSQTDRIFCNIYRYFHGES